ncbi:GntR family transcriptional regulator [Streptomyces sp. NPDC102364]|uniref:GntR family transcriptional regulator n=2 Tax=Streptomyces TaxID=1883 RepID=UPI00382F83DC
MRRRRAQGPQPGRAACKSARSACSSISSRSRRASSAAAPKSAVDSPPAGSMREAFRLLTHERLLVHELNRGVFVRRPTATDVTDIYRMRLLVECAAIRSLGDPPYALEGLRTAAAEGEKAAAAEDWNALGAANFHFHRELVALAGSPRVDEAMRSVLAELRLAFHALDDPRALHSPYLERNQALLESLAQGDARQAEQLLERYLDHSRGNVLHVERSGDPEQ